MKKILLGSFLAASILASNALSKEFILDKAHTNVAFKIKHLQISNVNGNFKDYDAVVDFDSTKFEFNKLQANVKVTSINTENKARDAHLQQDDFFKAKTHPNITFYYEQI